MREVLHPFKDAIIQIATPYNTGATGFYLKNYNLIVTNEHIVRDNRFVVINGEKIKKQLSTVMFIDPKLDLAFLAPPQNIELPQLFLGNREDIAEGVNVIAIGHPFGLKFSTTEGRISNVLFERNSVYYIQHDAAFNPGNSGGPLINLEGKIIGINTLSIEQGDNIGFSLPIYYLQEILDKYAENYGKIGARCISCSNLVFEETVEQQYCPHCGTFIEIPSQVELYEPIGVAYTIEQLLIALGHDVNLARSGLNIWVIQEGSALINISYYEKTGLITGDAYLCILPNEKENIKPLYEYLLRQNYQIEGLTFSIKGQDIILSLHIDDRYLNVDTGVKLFDRLFKMADHFDNTLVEEYGASWKTEKPI